jgi:hypothetical protein
MPSAVRIDALIFLAHTEESPTRSRRWIRFQPVGPTRSTEEHADTNLRATETGSGRIRTFSCQCLAVSSDAVALSLIAASQRSAGVPIRRAAGAVSWSQTLG